MNIRRTAVSIGVVLFAAASTMTMAEEKNSLTASVRIGATFVDSETVDSDFSFRNFGSRIKWSGEKDFENGLTGIGYLEFGLNPDNNSRGSSGVDRTRHAWAGVKGGFGSVKIGAQYAAFYDMVSGHTDIAWWGSCWTQFECSRETRVLKYNGSSGPLSFAASVQGNPEDDGNDAGDQIELGVNYQISGITVGLATAVHAEEGNNDSGTLVGLVVKGKAGPVGLGLTYQLADEDFAAANAGEAFADTTDDFSNVTITGSFGPAYAVYNRGDSGRNNPQFGTLGYTLNIGEGSLMYFEYQFIDDDTPADEETIVRATYKYDFGVL